MVQHTFAAGERVKVHCFDEGANQGSITVARHKLTLLKPGAVYSFWSPRLRRLALRA